MAHHAISLSSSRRQQQQQKPAGSCKAATKAKAPKTGMDGWEIPAGYIVRNGHKVIAKPIRAIGKRDEEILLLAVRQYGFLLPIPRTVLTLAGFAARIELHYATPQARAIADTLHRLSA